MLVYYSIIQDVFVTLRYDRVLTYSWPLIRTEFINKLINKLIYSLCGETHNLEVPGSSPGWSTNRFQKDVKQHVILAFKTRIIAVKSRFYSDFLFFYPYPFDCQTIPFDSHHSVIFCYRNCYTKAGSQKNVAMNGKWLLNWRHANFRFQELMSNFVAKKLH